MNFNKKGNDIKQKYGNKKYIFRLSGCCKY